MTTEQFTLWLHGYAEIHNSAPTEDEWKIIKDNLKLLFLPKYRTDDKFIIFNNK